MVGDVVGTAWIWDGAVRAYGIAGIDGIDGAGIEYIFASKADEIQYPENQRPLASFPYDQPGNVAGVQYYDGYPLTLSVDEPFLHRYSRQVPGQPMVGDIIGTDWIWDGGVRFLGVAVLSDQQVARLRGDFFMAIAGSAWSTAEADAATPGDNVISDTVTLYQAGGAYIETRAWNGVAWIAITQRINGNILFPGSVTVNALAANSVDLGSATVFGTLTAAHIDSDVRNVKVLYSNTSGLSMTTTGVFPLNLGTALSAFDSLFFVGREASVTRRFDQGWPWPLFLLCRSRPVREQEIVLSRCRLSKTVSSTSMCRSLALRSI